MFLNTWRKVQPTLCDRSGSCSLVRPQPIAYIAGQVSKFVYVCNVYLKCPSQDWTNSKVGFLVGFPVLMCNAAIWLFFSNRSKKSVNCDHYWAAVGTSTDVVRYYRKGKKEHKKWGKFTIHAYCASIHISNHQQHQTGDPRVPWI